MRLHARLLVVLAAVATLALALVPAASAQAADPTVTVTVTGPGGAPLEGVESLDITLAPVPTTDYFYTAEIEPGESYTFDDMGQGEFSLSVSPRGGRYLPGESEAFRIELGEKVERTIELEIGGLVEGTVRNPDGSAVENPSLGSVVLQKQADDGAWSGYSSALVRPKGTYEVPIPATGTYRIEYTSLSNQFWARSEPLALTRDSVETVDLTVQEGGSVSGVVDVEGTSEVTPEPFVGAYELVDGEWTAFDSAQLDPASGRYVVYLAGPEDREIRLGVTDYATFTYSYWDGTKYGAGVVEDATTISVPGGGSVTGKDFTLRLGGSTPEAIENTAPPQVSGTPTVGQKLTATTGSWSVENPDVALQWRRGGVDIDGATGDSYTLTQADVGQSVTVAAVASKSGYATSAESVSAAVGPVVPATKLADPNVWVVAVPGKSKVTFAVLVWALGVSPTKVDGQVTVNVGDQQLATRAVKNGVALVEVTGQPKGKRSYTVAYSGNAKINAGSRTVGVTVR